MSSRWLGRYLRETAQFIRLLLTRPGSDPQGVYELLCERNNLGEQSLYMNLGYWDGVDRYDDACQAMAERLAIHAGVRSGDRLLDVGCGFGDQDAFWMTRFSPRRLVAVDLSPAQVAAAHARFGASPIEFCRASATRLPFAAGTFDRVLSLEAAVHFDTRDSFFREANRILVPGGSLGVADTIPEGQPRGMMGRLGAHLGRALWQVPAANQYSIAAYREKLAAAGFVSIVVEDVTGAVFEPFKRYARERVRALEVRARVHPLLRRVWASPWGGHLTTRYVLVRAVKPR